MKVLILLISIWYNMCYNKTEDENFKHNLIWYTAWKLFKYGVISGLYFPNTGKCGPEITPYLDTFHAVITRINQSKTLPKHVSCKFKCNSDEKKRKIEQQ